MIDRPFDAPEKINIPKTGETVQCPLHRISAQSGGIAGRASIAPSVGPAE